MESAVEGLLPMGYALRDYLEIDADAAARQWSAVLARETPAAGRRQEPFRPIEVVLCFGLFRVLDPRRYGGRNIHLLPAAARTLADTLRRPPGSLTNKMLNLSFDRAHGGREEPELFLRLSADPALFLHLYATILSAARRAGLGADRVPDCVGCGDHVALLGQEELGEAEIGTSLEALRDTPPIGVLRELLGERDTERLAEQRIRLGQHRFAAAVLASFDHRCGFCGFAPRGLGRRGLLVASHIKPWAACDNDRERLDPRNGIAACAIHDKAFDGGLLTVNGGYRIHRAAGLEARLADRVTDALFGPSIVGPTLLLGDGARGPARRYLDYHREHVFGQRA